MSDDKEKKTETVEEKRTPEEIEYEEELKRVSEVGKERLSKHFSLWFILSVFLLIGVPVWWKTTTPERWDLPDVAVLSRRAQSIKHHYKVSVVFFDNSPAIQDVKNHFQQAQIIKNDNSSLHFATEYNVRQAFQREVEHYDKWDKKDVNVLDSIFTSKELQKNSHLTFYILPSSIQSGSLLHYGQNRNFFVDVTHFPSSSFQSSLHSLVTDQVQASQTLSQSFYLNLNNNDQRNLLLLGREFEFVFDIIFEDENGLFAGKSKPEVEKIREELNTRIKKTFDVLVSGFYAKCGSLSTFFRMNFVSQMFHYVLPDNYVSNNVRANSSSDNFKVLELPKVQKIFDYVESKRIDHGNDNAYHLILFVTKDMKLKFAEPKAKNSDNNEESSILVTTPFRGSILVDNNDETLVEGFQHFLHEFFRLHDFRIQDIESIVRSIAQKQIHKTLQSLQATEQLLNTVSNIVIEQKISQRMKQSFSDALSAIDMLETGSDISAVLDKSHSAYLLSEKAFYDPSLLSLLYFPEDQKYAIYLPLFLPIGLPLVFNVIKIFKKWRNARKVKTQ